MSLPSSTPRLVATDLDGTLLHTDGTVTALPVDERGALGPANRVAAVDAQTYEVEKYLLVGQRVWQLAFTPDQKMLFTTNGTSNDVSVIDVAAEKVVKSIPVGLLPWGVAISPE